MNSSQNTCSTLNSPIIDNPLCEQFPWLRFETSNTEISYLEKFLSEFKTENLDFLKLDIRSLNKTLTDDTHHLGMQEVIRDQYSRLVKYGNISSVATKDHKNDKNDHKKGKNENKKEKNEREKHRNTDKDDKNCENNYDLDDSFIDDTEVDKGLIQMQVYESKFSDYLSVRGGFTNLMENNDYKNRIKELEEIRFFSNEDKEIYLQEKKKRKKNYKKNTKTKNKEEIKKNSDEFENNENKIKSVKFNSFSNGFSNIIENKNQKEEGSLSVSKQTNGSNSNFLCNENSQLKQKRSSLIKNQNFFNTQHPTLSKIKLIE